MLLVKTYLAPSKLHGIGLFANQFIPAGAHVWRFVSGFDLQFAKDFPNELSPAAREQFLKYAYTSKGSGTYILCSDDARFFNHSDAPNVINVSIDNLPEGLDVAIRDIEPSEELTYDYRVFADPLPSNDG